MPRRNSAKTHSSLEAVSSDNREEEHHGDGDVPVASSSSKQVALEALFQAAKTELQHMGGGGTATEDEEEEDMQQSPVVSSIEVHSTSSSSQPMLSPVIKHTVTIATPMTPTDTDQPSPSTPQVGRKRKHPAKPGKYVCNYCGRGCAKPSVLEKHLRAHTGERPYPCIPCGFAFKTKSNLYKHCKSRSHALKVSGYKGGSEDGGQFEGVEDDDEEDDDGDRIPNTPEVIIQMDTADAEKVSGVKEFRVPVSAKEGQKEKELKYYIVEVKEGDSLEEVVKKARLAAGSEVETSTDSVKTVRKLIEEKKKRDGGELMTMEPKMVFESSQKQMEAVGMEPKIILESSQKEEVSERHHEIELDMAVDQVAETDVIASNEQALVNQHHTLQIQLAPQINTQEMISLNPVTPVVQQAFTLFSTSPSTPVHVVSPGMKTSRNANLTPEMLKARISELINKNQAIVNTPMADAPRPKRMSRQSSESQSTPKPKIRTPAPQQQQQQLYVQGADGKITPVVVQEEPAASDHSIAALSSPTVLSVAPSSLHHNQVVSIASPAVVDGGAELIKQLLMRGTPPISQPEEGLQYLCTACSLLFSTQESMLLHAKYQCPSSKAVISSSSNSMSASSSVLSTLDQNEAVLAQIGQQLEAAEHPSTPSTPLFMEIVDPGSPLKRGRPRGMKSRSFSESIIAPTPDVGGLVSRFSLNKSDVPVLPDSKSVDRASSLPISRDGRPKLKLTIPAPVFSSPQTAPTTSTPLPEWKLRLKDKLLKRSMSMDKLAAGKADNISKTESQSAKVIIDHEAQAVKKPMEVISVLSSALSRPPLKRQASVQEESESKKRKEESDRKVLTVEIGKVDADETVVNKTEDRVEVSVMGDGRTMTVTHLQSGKQSVVSCAGPSLNVLKNIVQNEDVFVSEMSLAPNNQAFESITNTGLQLAPSVKVLPHKLQTLSLPSSAALKIPGLVKSKPASPASAKIAKYGASFEVKEEGSSEMDTRVPTKTGSTFPTISAGSPSKVAAVNCEELFKVPDQLQDKASVVYLLLGHSYPLLSSVPAVTFCSLLKPQPMYVEQSEGGGISMYSNWQVAPSAALPVSDVGIREFLGLHRAHRSEMAEESGKMYMSAGSSQPHRLTDSSYWRETHKDDTTEQDMTAENEKTIMETLDTSQQQQQQQQPQIQTTSITTTAPTPTSCIPPLVTVTEHMPTPYTSETKNVQSTSKQAGKIRVCKGGYRTDEEYVYVRGRGRGRYVCEECGIRCKKPSMLRKHIHTHTDLRPFTCRYCRFAFKTKGNLTKHMKSKAHYKRCTELGIVPVPTVVDDPATDTQAMHRLQQIHAQGSSVEGEDDDEEERYWVVDQQFASMDAADQDENEHEDDDEDSEGEEVVEEMVIDEDMQLVEILPPKSESPAPPVSSSAMDATGKTTADPWFIAVQTSTGEQPLFVKIAPKPQRLLEGEVAASLLDLSQTASGLTKGKLGNIQTDEEDSSNKSSDPRLSSLVSALKSRTSRPPQANKEQDGRRDVQQVIHLLRDSKASTQLHPSTIEPASYETASPLKTCSSTIASGFVPPVFPPSPSRPASAVSTPTSIAMPALSALSVSTPTPIAMPAFSASAVSTPNSVAMPALSASAVSTPIPIALPALSASSVSTPTPIAVPAFSASTPNSGAMPVWSASAVSTPNSVAMPDLPAAIIPSSAPVKMEANREPDSPPQIMIVKVSGGVEYPEEREIVVRLGEAVADEEEQAESHVKMEQSQDEIATYIITPDITTSQHVVQGYSMTDSSSTVTHQDGSEEADQGLIITTLNTSTIVTPALTSFVTSALTSVTSTLSTTSLVASTYDSTSVTSGTSYVSSGAPLIISSVTSASDLTSPVTSVSLGSSVTSASHVTSGSDLTSSVTSASYLTSSVTSASLGSTVTSVCDLSTPESSIQMIQLPSGQSIPIPVGYFSLHGLPAVAPSSQIPLGVHLVTTPNTRNNQTIMELVAKDKRSAPLEIQPIPGKVAVTETVNGKFVCDVCDKEFPKQTQLQMHKNIHFFERPFKCEDCNVAYKTKGVLEKHLRSESHIGKATLRKEYPLPKVVDEAGEENPRPHKCDDCSIAFRIHGHLSKHLRSKVHISRLENTHKIPAGTYKLLEQTGFRGVVPTDCHSALDSIQKLVAKRLKVSHVPPEATISVTDNGEAVITDWGEKQHTPATVSLVSTTVAESDQGAELIVSLPTAKQKTADQLVPQLPPPPPLPQPVLTIPASIVYTSPSPSRSVQVVQKAVHMASVSSTEENVLELTTLSKQVEHTSQLQQIAPMPLIQNTTNQQISTAVHHPASTAILPDTPTQPIQMMIPQVRCIYVCSQCRSGFDSMESLNLHLPTHNNSTKAGPT